MTLSVLRIVPASMEFAESFNACLDVVARERRYLVMTEAPPLFATREFLREFLSDGGVQVFALDGGNRVVGWCDIVRSQYEGFRHVGRLGMGLLPEYRGRGEGRRLAQAAIERAWKTGLERVELDVFATNTSAVALYKQLGFATEGVKKRVREIDGVYDDYILMALFRPDEVPEPRT